MKKLIALLLALTMVLCIFAGCGDTNNDVKDNDNNVVDNNGEDANVVDSDPNATYTYNYSLSTFPTNWNYFTYQTSTDAEILDYIVDGFYAFDYNETKDGYQMVPAMATGDPEDVTADYVGQYGITEDSVNLAWKVTLRDDLKWENGDPIVANDFVESAKRLLDPAAQNYRADSLYSGSFIVYNAEAYLKQGKYAYSNMVSSDMLDEEYVAVADMTVNEEGYYTVNGKDVYINLNDGGNWGSYGMAAYYGAGYFTACEDAYGVLAAAADADGYVRINAETYAAIADVIAVLHDCASADDYAAQVGDYAYVEWEELAFYGADMPEMDFSEVGIFALSDTELVYVITKPLAGFYLKYNMPSYLVHTATYDALANVDANGIYTNTYGTSADTTISYGPYKLTEFQADKHYVLERNENYYGLTEDTYQTTTIDVVLVSEKATQHQMFLQGELDSFGLDAEYMPTYQLSDNTYYYTGASTYAVTFNPDYDGLVAAQAQAGAGINKTILTVKEFRMAMSFALDRLAFCLATSPTNNAAFGLYSGLIVCDPEAGTTYRSTEQAKDALIQFWGLADDIGEGKLYSDKDDAIASITGYNLTKAQELFNQAYDIAIAEGLMTENDVVEIKIGLPSATANFYLNGYEFLVNNYTEAVKGTKLEGKLTFSKDDTIGNDFATALQNNTIDMLFGVGWTGSALDPYGLFRVYVDPNYQYDSGIDYTSYDLTINLNGTDYTTDMATWYEIMNGTDCEVVDAEGNKTTLSYGSNTEDPEARLTILAALEQEILCQYNFVPIMDSSSASLKGMQIKYYTEEYIFGMAFGGMKYYKYNYSDSQWAEYVASCGGTLDYT